MRRTEEGVAREGRKYRTSGEKGRGTGTGKENGGTGGGRVGERDRGTGIEELISSSDASLVGIAYKRSTSLLRSLRWEVI